MPLLGERGDDISRKYMIRFTDPPTLLGDEPQAIIKQQVSRRCFAPASRLMMCLDLRIWRSYWGKLGETMGVQKNCKTSSDQRPVNHAHAKLKLFKNLQKQCGCQSTSKITSTTSCRIGRELPERIRTCETAFLDNTPQVP